MRHFSIPRFLRRISLACFVVTAWSLSGAPDRGLGDASILLLHLSFDGRLELARGSGPVSLTPQGPPVFVTGKLGKALKLDDNQRVALPQSGNLNKARGTLCFWVRPDWNGDDGRNHILFEDDIPFTPPGNGCFRLWQWSVGLLRFDTRDSGDHYLTSRVSAQWRAGEWHHAAVCWDCESGATLYVDGRPVATRSYTFTPKPGRRLFFNGPAVLDDVRVYAVPLAVDHVARIMSGLPIETVRLRAFEAPRTIRPGEPFEVRVVLDAPEGLRKPHALEVELNGAPIAAAPLPDLPPDSRNLRLGPFQVTIPEYLFPPAGNAVLSARIQGAFTQETAPRQTVTVQLPPPAQPPSWTLGPDGTPLCNGKPALPSGEQFGILLDGEFAPNTPAGRKRIADWIRTGKILDALPCRLVDAVEAGDTDHGYFETAPTRVEELLPGRRFRLTGRQEDVTTTRRRHGRTMPVLPGFGWRLHTAPRPTPHVVVVESIDDCERYLEVAIDAARGSAPDPHLVRNGVGARDLMNLYAAYNGREYPASGRTYRLSFMVFPKTDAVDVMITCSRNVAGLKSSAPAAVSSIRVYEVLRPLRTLPNPVSFVENMPRRSLGLFDPYLPGMFERYGFADTGREARACTIRRFMAYNRFLGFNRFEFRPFLLNEKALFHTPRFPQAGDLDAFGEILPEARRNGLTVTPRIMYLHSYHKLFENDPDNIVQSRTGEFLHFGREGPIPDVLRPEVQKIVLDAVRAVLEATHPWRDVVQSVSFDTSIGGVYAWRSGPACEVGYSTWDLAEFCRETGRPLPADVRDHAARYRWVRKTCWEEWLDWRTARWRRFVSRIRNLVRGDGRRFILDLRVMPRPAWHEQHVPLREIYRWSLFDPAKFAGERNLLMRWFIRVNADRYFGRLWWKPWFYHPDQPKLIGPRAMEIYYNYWELPRHPWRFRVGPGSPIGRAFFEPYTYAMRTTNPRNMTVFCWFRGSYGHETDLRRWARAYLALPAVPPSPFEGKIADAEPPADERLWIRRFGPRLCVLNDSPKTRTVVLETPVQPASVSAASVWEATSNRAVILPVERAQVRIRCALEPWDMRVFEVRSSDSGGR